MATAVTKSSSIEDIERQLIEKLTQQLTPLSSEIQSLSLEMDRLEQEGKDLEKQLAQKKAEFDAIREVFRLKKAEEVTIQRKLQSISCVQASIPVPPAHENGHRTPKPQRQNTPHFKQGFSMPYGYPMQMPFPYGMPPAQKQVGTKPCKWGQNCKNKNSGCTFSH